MRYDFAEDDECGLLYRPGEVEESLNHCKLKRGHVPEKVHSTRQRANAHSGFEWVTDDGPRMVWPDGSTQEIPKSWLE